MNLVIAIDENVFTRLFDNGIEDYEIANDDLCAIAKSIRTGIPFEKIRAEIEQTTSRYTISRERGAMGQVEWSDRLIKESEVLEILDKYKPQVRRDVGIWAIKALEQESCSDAISRQAVQDYIAEYLSQYLYNDVREAVEVIDEYIGELPSVNPQEPKTDEENVHREREQAYMQGYEDACKKYRQYPKTGHWIDDKCSECGKGIEDLIASPEWYRDEEPNFCPFCGIKIVDEQESEDE